MLQRLLKLVCFVALPAAGVFAVALARRSSQAESSWPCLWSACANPADAHAFALASMAALCTALGCATGWLLRHRETRTRVAPVRWRSVAALALGLSIVGAPGIGIASTDGLALAAAWCAICIVASLAALKFQASRVREACA